MVCTQVRRSDRLVASECTHCHRVRVPAWDAEDGPDTLRPPAAPRRSSS
jgi:hypothetical protein